MDLVCVDPVNLVELVDLVANGGSGSQWLPGKKRWQGTTFHSMN